MAETQCMQPPWRAFCPLVATRANLSAAGPPLRLRRSMITLNHCKLPKKDWPRAGQSRMDEEGPPAPAVRAKLVSTAIALYGNEAAEICGALLDSSASVLAELQVRRSLGAIPGLLMLHSFVVRTKCAGQHQEMRLGCLRAFGGSAGWPSSDPRAASRRPESLRFDVRLRLG